MATVTGITAAKALEILGESVVSATINGSGHLICTRENGSSFDAGDVTLINSAETAAAIAAHSGLDEGVHGLSGAGNDVVGTTKTQTLTNKTLASPIITGKGAEYYARRITDLAKASDTSMAVDPVLQFAGEALAKYKIEVCARVKLDAGTPGGFQFGFKTPTSGYVKTVSYVAPISDAIAGGHSAAYNNHASFVGSRIDLADSAVIDGLLTSVGGGTYTFLIDAIIETATDPGTIGLMWSQYASDVLNTTMLTGSTLFAKRIA